MSCEERSKLNIFRRKYLSTTRDVDFGKSTYNGEILMLDKYLRTSTRREFLKLIGKGTALGVCLPMPTSCNSSLLRGRLPFSGEVVGEDIGLCHELRDGTLKIEVGAPEPSLYDVIIIGAGISGLAAAWKLQRCGVNNFLILEKANQIGGTCIAGKEGDITFPWCAHYIESPQPRSKYLLEICEDLGVIIDYDGEWPVVNPNYIVPPPEISLLAGNRWRPNHFPIQIASSQDVMDFEWFRQNLYRWVKWRDEDGRPAFGCPVEQTSPAEEVRRLDNISMLDYLRSIGVRSKLVDWYVNNRTMDEYGCRVEDVSAWAGIQFWAQSNSSFLDFEPPATPAPALLSWPEGNAFLAKGLARRLSAEQLRLRALTVNVRNERERALVTYIDQKSPLTPLYQRGDFTTLQSKWVIYAAPKNSVYHLIPELERAGRTEFKRCKYVPWITAAVHLRRPPQKKAYTLAWENLSYNSWGLGYIDNRHLMRQRNRIDLPTILTYYAALCSDIEIERYELFKEGWEFWARLILQELEEMHPHIS
ncbi:MAG: FAD-dependent oxidoreductase, partial [Candidatus Poribacteria bacterium]